MFTNTVRQSDFYSERSTSSTIFWTEHEQYDILNGARAVRYWIRIKACFIFGIYLKLCRLDLSLLLHIFWLLSFWFRLYFSISGTFMIFKIYIYRLFYIFKHESSIKSLMVWSRFHFTSRQDRVGFHPSLYKIFETPLE